MNIVQRVSRLGVLWTKPLSRTDALTVLLKNGRQTFSAIHAPPVPPLVKKNEPPISVSSPEGSSKSYAPKLVKLVDEISQLTLLEVSELNELLKKTLNIPDTPMMGSMPMSFAPQKQEEEIEEATPVAVQTNFTLKLMKYDEAKKVPLIKELKSLLEGMNLVQAKKFVESAPAIVKADIPKDEAEKLQAALTAVGATCEIS